MSLFFHKSKKGITTLMRKAKTNARAALCLAQKEAQRCEFNLGALPTWATDVRRAEENLIQIEIVQAEMKILHNMFKDSRTALAQRQAHVSHEIDRTTMHDDKDSAPPLAIHPAIKTKALEFIRA